MLNKNHNYCLNTNKVIMQQAVFVPWNSKREFISLNSLITTKMKSINFFYKHSKNIFNGKEGTIKRRTTD